MFRWWTILYGNNSEWVAYGFQANEWTMDALNLLKYLVRNCKSQFTKLIVTNYRTRKACSCTILCLTLTSTNVAVYRLVLWSETNLPFFLNNSMKSNKWEIQFPNYSIDFSYNKFVCCKNLIVTRLITKVFDFLNPDLVHAYLAHSKF